MGDLPKEAEKLLALAPDRFVSERKALAKTLRDEGRKDDAQAVEALRKPPAVVLAANRAARARPNAARAAAEAAVGVRDAQVSGGAQALEHALGELEDALDLLAQVALAHLAPTGKKPSEDMRRRLRALLRNAAADEDARQALARGALVDELEVSGFAAYAGLALAPAATLGPRQAAGPSREERADERRRERQKELRAELADAERELRDATAAARSAERERKRAERAVETLRKKLEESR